MDHMRVLILPLSGCVLAAAVGQAHAQYSGVFDGFGLFKDARFEQTGSGVYSTVSYGFTATALEQDPSSETVTAVELNWSDAGGSPRSGTLTPSGIQWTYWGGSYANEADLSDVFPDANDYEYLVTMDGIGTVSEVLDGPGDLWPDTVPLVNNYDALQSADPLSDIVVGFDGFSSPADANLRFTTVTILDEHGWVWSDKVANDITSVSIPAGTLAGGVEYEMHLLYESREYTGGLTTFPDAQRNFEFDYRTVLSLVTVPAPPSGVAFAGAMVWLARRRRRA